MALYASLLCYPPLEQIHIVPVRDKRVPFVVTLEWSKSLPRFPWEVVICYRRSTADSVQKWIEFPLMESQDETLDIYQRQESQDPTLRHFRSTFSAAMELNTLSEGAFAFTVKYRLDCHSRWCWVEEQFGTRDGNFIIQREVEQRANIRQLLDIQTDWSIEKLSGGCDSSPAFHLKSAAFVQRANDGDSVPSSQLLGKVRAQQRYMVLSRHSEPWLGPRHGKHVFSIEEDAIMCCFLNEDSHHITLLGMNGADGIVTLFQSNEDNQIVVWAMNDGPIDCSFQIIAAVSASLEGSISAAVNGARTIFASHGQHRHIGLVPRGSAETIPRSEKKAPVDDWCDGLAYCTYNSLGTELTTAKILSGLESLADIGVSVSSLIIDDNWQTVDHPGDESVWQLHRAWTEFEANKEGFPEGLKSAISRIRREHPAVIDIAVWHALLGYWKGISPDSRLAKEYRTVNVRAQVMGHLTTNICAVDPHDIERLYDDFYAFLSSCGINSVKTDVQFLLDELKDSPARHSFVKAYQAAWSGAHMRHFQGRAISCMSMIPQILFHSFLHGNGPRIILRNSDDFFPEINTSHTQHIFINAHNSLLTQHLNAIQDWDMFQTSHKYSKFHAAARCISGGPVYITDTPGKHDVRLINEISAPNQHGRTVVLRPTRIAKTISAYDAFSDGHILKIGTSANDDAFADMLGLFNIAEGVARGLIAVTDISYTHFRNGSLAGGVSGKVLIGSYQNPKVYTAVDLSSPVGPRSLIHVTLEARGFDILTAYKIHVLTLPSTTLSVALLGLLGKMSGAAAMSHSSLIVDGSGEAIFTMTLKALGTLGIWISGLKTEVLLPRITISLVGSQVPQKHISWLSQDESISDASILQIDVLQAWKDLVPMQNSDLNIDIRVVINSATQL